MLYSLYVSKNELNTKNDGTPYNVPSEVKIFLSTASLKTTRCSNTTDITKVPRKPSSD